MKSFVKLARESISGKDFESALNYAINGLESDEILDGDKASLNKYNLLVLKALSLHNLGRDKEAIESYEMAGMIHPELPLAWQGLISLYEKGQNDESKKIKPLENLARILKANGDAKKHHEILHKLINELKSGKLYDEAVKHYKWLMGEEADQFYQDSEEFKADKKDRLRTYVELLEAQETNYITKEIEKRKFRLGAGTIPQIRCAVETEVALTSPLDSLYRDLMESLPETEGNQIRQKLAKRIFLKLPSMVEKSEALEQLLQICKDNGGKDAELTEIFLDLSDILAYDREIISEYSGLENAKYLEAAKYLVKDEIVDFTPNQQSVFSLYVSSKILSASDRSEELIKQLPLLNALIASFSVKYGVSYPLMKQEMIKLEVFGLVKLERYELARSKLSLLPDDKELFEARLKVYDALDDHESSIALLQQQLIDDPENASLLSMLGWKYFTIKSLEKAFDFLSKAEMKTPEDAEVLYRLGRVFWSQDSKLKSLNYFLRSVKSNPEHAGSFLYLGLYYSSTGDLVRAEKCFHKALRLNEDLVEAAVNLAKIWITGAWDQKERQLQTSNNVIDLLSAYSSSNLRNWHLWKYLGIAYSWKEDRQLAITAFQNALKGEHSNELECLLLLAEAYRADLKLTAALKAYARAITVDPGCKMARIGHATVLMDTGHFEEAIEEFEAILKDIEGHYSMPLYFQIAQACTLWFKELILKVEADLAMKVATKGVEILAAHLMESNLLYGWRTIASLSSSLHQFSKREEMAGLFPLFEKIQTHAMVKGNEVCDSILTIDSPCLRLSALSHLKCLSLCPPSEKSLHSLFLSEIAQDFYGQYKISGNADLLGFADGYCNQAVSLCSGNFGAWNLLGLIAMEQGRFAYSQHAFIVALEALPATEDSSSIWMNLADFYLRNKDMELVSQAIEKAQMANVENPMAWFALAQLAYNDASANVHPEERARKAFEYLGEAVGCPKASLHVQVNLEYAWLGWERLRYATGSDRKELLVKLEVALQRIVNIESDHRWALHTLALVKEQLFADPAVVKTLLERSLDDEHKEIVLSNLVRVLVSAGDYEGALGLPLVPQDEIVRFFQALAKARLADSPGELKPFTLKAFHDQEPCLWKLAIWESAKVGLFSKQDITALLNDAAAVEPTAQVVLGAKFMDALINEKGAEEIEALLLGLIELATEPVELPNPAIISLVTGYLSSQGCHVEAFEFYMSVLENNLSDSRLWETLAVLFDGFKGDEGIDQAVKESVAQALREWLDIRVPQMGRRPRMEEMEAYQERLFPKIDASTATTSIARVTEFPPLAETVADPA